MMRLVAITCAFLFTASACKGDDPTESVDAPRADADLTDAPTDGPPADGDPACVAAADDYTPRTMSSATDPFPACVSDADPDMYVVINASVSTIARIAAFEQIAAALFISGAPAQQAFVDERITYLQANGLESRVSRREDEHYPPAMNAGGMVAACNTLTPAEQAAYPDRCIGPLTLTPFIADAFTAGAQATDPLARRLAAARIEAGLLHFLYLSVYKEAATCRSTPADCDSSWAYYGGGDQRSGGKGLARYVRGLETLTHDRAFDGVLAVRCWRGLDDPAVTTDDAMFDPLRTIALAQLDRAALRAVALIVRARLVAMQSSTGDDQAVHWEMIRYLARSLGRETALRDAARAAILATELARTDATQVDEAAIIGVLDAVFPCP